MHLYHRGAGVGRPGEQPQQSAGYLLNPPLWGVTSRAIVAAAQTALIPPSTPCSLLRAGSSWRGARETPTTTGYHQLQTLPSYHLSDLVLGLASPGAFPCPENSPSFSVRFSKRAGDGHLVAFGTEFGQLIIVDTRAEARVQRDHNGPVGWGQTDRTRGITSGCGAKTRQRPGGVEGSGNVGLCRSWGVRQPEVVAQYRAFINCIFDLEWAHDDTRIVLAGGDAKIRVHDTETHAEVCFMCGGAEIYYFEVGIYEQHMCDMYDSVLYREGSRGKTEVLRPVRYRFRSQGTDFKGGAFITRRASSVRAFRRHTSGPTKA